MKDRTNNVMHSFRAAVLFFFFLISAIVFARDIEIFVEDEDLEMPLEGAVITLRDRQQFVCNEDGIAFITLPDNRPAIITITYPGYDPLRLSIPAAISNDTEYFTASLRLGGIMQSQELVIEAAHPDTSETRSGRSVAISDRELTRTSEIGIIEDVMTSVKLLPGVGYTGMFGAMPSIRGGDPGDLMVSFDGFYLERPYHWVGAFSIFDPKMVSSARLSHGVFSARYGHTISGLLEISSKSPSPTETELEIGIGSSAANLNLSVPIAGKGGVLFMGKVTYWDTLVFAAKQLSKVVDNENLDMINTISTSPYIRSAALASNYRFTPNLDWRLNLFFGSDGVGAEFNRVYDNEDRSGKTQMKAIYDNYQGFLITGIVTSPHPAVALKLTGGVGFNRTITDDIAKNDVTIRYNEDFLDKYGNIITDEKYTTPSIDMKLLLEHTIFNAQVRSDVDWHLGNGLIAAFGVQELYSVWSQYQDIKMGLEMPISSLSDDRLLGVPEEIRKILPYIKNIPDLAIIMPSGYDSKIYNQGFTTSAYGLLEYISPNQRFGTELGLRLDHLYFIGDGFTAKTVPAFNPRLNLDFNILKNNGNIDSMDFTVGTGLFSSVNQLVSFLDGSDGFGDADIKFNRSWTSIVGVKTDWSQRYSFNIEGYYKHVFDRAYVTADIASSDSISPTFHFNGIGNVWGFDLQLQKLESRYWDGWISYTFTWAKYLDPNAGGEGVSMGSIDTEEQWYYPSFHRFHNANIVLNIKPVNHFNIAIRFGFASGQERNKVSNEIEPYPVLTINDKGDPVIVQKYRRKRLEPGKQGVERSAWSLPLDMKFSFFPANKNGRSSMEIYFAGENILSLIYDPRSDRNSFNSYTGEIENETSSGNFELPIPMVSFGFKWRY